jgi:hypothetical protein
VAGKDNSTWITTWAPEPEDVLWENLPINYVSITGRKAIAAAIVTATVLFYTIPVGFVQGLASLDNISSSLPFLNPILEL